jgi:hypothetical protein
MASSKEYLNYVLEQLADVEGITFRPMMGEYILYCQGKVVGGVYDDRLLLKPVPAALRLLGHADGDVTLDFPGGTLEVSLTEAHGAVRDIYLTGPAVTVSEGEYIGT